MMTNNNYAHIVRCRTVMDVARLLLAEKFSVWKTPTHPYNCFEPIFYFPRSTCIWHHYYSQWFINNTVRYVSFFSLPWTLRFAGVTSTICVYFLGVNEFAALRDSYNAVDIVKRVEKPVLRERANIRNDDFQKSIMKLPQTAAWVIKNIHETIGIPMVWLKMPVYWWFPWTARGSAITDWQAVVVPTEPLRQITRLTTHIYTHNLTSDKYLYVIGD